MIYSFRGIDKNGEKIKNKIEASSLSEAKSKIRANGIIYSEIKEQKTSNFNFSLKTKPSISPKILSNLSRELAIYIRSGISIVQALKIVKNHYTNDKKMELFLNILSTYLDEGENLHSALAKQDIFKIPEFYKQSIKVSEDGGILDKVLLELSNFLKEQEKIKKEIKLAFAYPVFMIFISLIMIAFMLTFVVPQITSIFNSMHQELPKPTQVVIALGIFFKDNFLLMTGGILIFVAIFIFFKKHNESFAYFTDKLMLSLPFFGKIIEKSELGRFSYMASLLTTSGVVFVQTINLSANILNNKVLKNLFLNASEEVVEGKLLSTSLNNSNIKIDFAFIQAVALGEETSEVEAVLSNISELYFEENRDKISFLLTILEPVLMLFVGGSIGFIVVAMLLPIFSMSIN